MRTDRVLKIDRSDADTTLIDEDGHPIWSLRSYEEEEAFRSFAAKFGITIQSVRGRRGYAPPMSAVVAGFGPEVDDAARLYGKDNDTGDP